MSLTYIGRYEEREECMWTTVSTVKGVKNRDKVCAVEVRVRILDDSPKTRGEVRGLSECWKTKREAKC